MVRLVTSAMASAWSVLMALPRKSRVVRAVALAKALAGTLVRVEELWMDRFFRPVRPEKSPGAIAVAL